MKEQTKLYKKWWFWVCAVIILCLVYSVVVLTDNKSITTSANVEYKYINNYEDLNKFSENNKNQNIIIFGKIQSIRTTNIDNNYISEIILKDNDKYIYLDYDKKNTFKKDDILKVIFKYNNTFFDGTAIFDFDTHETYTTNKTYYIMSNDIISLELKKG